MKKQLIGLGVAALVFGGVVSANATLIGQSGGVVLDDRGTINDTTDDLYWIQDMNRFEGQSYTTQIAEIALLNGSTGTGPSGVWGDWQMADDSAMNALWEYSATSIMNIFVPSASTSYLVRWLGRYDKAVPNNPHHYVGDINIYGNDPVWKSKIYMAGDVQADQSLGAWVVASAADPIPEPATMLLFGTGLAGLVGLRIRKKKK